MTFQGTHKHSCTRSISCDEQAMLRGNYYVISYLLCCICWSFQTLTSVDHHKKYLVHVCRHVAEMSQSAFKISQKYHGGIRSPPQLLRLTIIFEGQLEEIKFLFFKEVQRTLDVGILRTLHSVPTNNQITGILP